MSRGISVGGATIAESVEPQVIAPSSRFAGYGFTKMLAHYSHVRLLAKTERTRRTFDEGSETIVSVSKQEGYKTRKDIMQG